MSGSKGNPFSNNGKWASGKVATIPVCLGELYDSRLTGDQLRLLLMLRHRSGMNGATWISWDTLVEDAGMPRTTLMRNLRRLRELGFIMDASRGFGHATFKAVSDPFDMYPHDLMDWELCGYYFVKDRTPEIKEILYSTNLVSPRNPRSATSGTKGNIDNCNNSSSATSGTSVVPPVAPQQCHQWHSNNINEFFKDKITVNSVHCAGPEVQPRALSSEENSSFPSLEGGDPPHRTEETNSDDLETSADGAAVAEAARRKALAVSLAASSSVTATERTAARKAKARKKKAERDASGETEEKRRYKEKTKGSRQTPASKLAEHCRVKFSDTFPNVKQSWWSIGGVEEDRTGVQAKGAVNVKTKNFRIAINLLKAYDDDLELVKKAWDYACDNWSELRREFKLKEGYPTIGWLMAFHDRVFARIQEDVSSRDQSESQRISGKFEW